MPRGPEILLWRTGVYLERYEWRSQTPKSISMQATASLCNGPPYNARSGIRAGVSDVTFRLPSALAGIRSKGLIETNYYTVTREKAGIHIRNARHRERAAVSPADQLVGCNLQSLCNQLILLRLKLLPFTAKCLRCMSKRLTLNQRVPG